MGETPVFAVHPSRQQNAKGGRASGRRFEKFGKDQENSKYSVHDQTSKKTCNFPNHLIMNDLAVGGGGFFGEATTGEFLNHPGTGLVG